MDEAFYPAGMGVQYPPLGRLADQSFGLIKAQTRQTTQAAKVHPKNRFRRK